MLTLIALKDAMSNLFLTKMESKYTLQNILFYFIIFAKSITFQLLTIIDGKLISRDSV